MQTPLGYLLDRQNCLKGFLLVCFLISVWVFLWRGGDGTFWKYRINSFAIRCYLMISEKAKFFPTCSIRKANVAGVSYIHLQLIQPHRRYLWIWHGLGYTDSSILAIFYDTKIKQAWQCRWQGHSSSLFCPRSLKPSSLRGNSWAPLYVRITFLESTSKIIRWTVLEKCFLPPGERRSSKVPFPSLLIWHKSRPKFLSFCF